MIKKVLFLFLLNFITISNVFSEETLDIDENLNKVNFVSNNNISKQNIKVWLHIFQVLTILIYKSQSNDAEIYFESEANESGIIIEISNQEFSFLEFICHIFFDNAQSFIFKNNWISQYGKSVVLIVYKKPELVFDSILFLSIFI